MQQFAMTHPIVTFLLVWFGGAMLLHTVRVLVRGYPPPSNNDEAE